MAITNQVKPVVKAFVKICPSAGKIEFTGADRTALKEFHFICERPTQYPLISTAFKHEFKAEIPPEDKVSDDQRKWCLCFIGGLAGKAGAYAHVGGKAQDLSVKNLSTEERKTLRNMLQKAGFKILFEKIAGSKSNYHSTMENTTHFHVYID